jgi:hypothetical protein
MHRAVRLMVIGAGIFQTNKLSPKNRKKPFPAFFLCRLTTPGNLKLIKIAMNQYP